MPYNNMDLLEYEEVLKILIALMELFSLFYLLLSLFQSVRCFPILLCLVLSFLHVSVSHVMNFVWFCRIVYVLNVLCV